MAKNIDRLAELVGISASYINAHEKEQAISQETKLRLLEAMGRSGELAAAFEESLSPVPSVKVFSTGSRYLLPINLESSATWELHCENGSQHQGTIASGRKNLRLPDDVETGYHQLHVNCSQEQFSCKIIITPKRCYEPDELQLGKKLWGTTIQLYTLRSEANWGIGDFGDLKKMLPEIAARGGAFIGMNPIHALYPAVPDNASPYSPSSRRWLNIIYIDVNAVPEFHDSEHAQLWWAQPDTQLMLEKARETEWVDYPHVTLLKLGALKLAYEHFCQLDKQQIRVVKFEQFRQQGGSDLQQQALFDALQAFINTEHPKAEGWLDWPEEYQDPHSAAVQQFAESYSEEIRFYAWLQWLADTQLAECFELCHEKNMPIGLYRDLAVGVAEGGSETWFDRSLYCLGASVGAPPDILGPLGQNWALPPMSPSIIVERGYAPFIELLRANMIHCGALRIDHVMSLLRLWWIPRGEHADQGAYVHYPVDDLIAILALESHRHRCMIIGEDLGTVPKEIIKKLRDSGIYSYKVLYFERSTKNVFKAPQSYPVQAMATLTTHDLPTLRGFWQADDLTRGEFLGLYPDKAVLKVLFKSREKEKQGLLNALHYYDCIPAETSKKVEGMEMNTELNHSLQYYAASSACALLGLQPEDWLDMEKPVNIPGTNREYPNWRRKLSHNIEYIFEDADINHLISEINQRRKNASAN